MMACIQPGNRPTPEVQINSGKGMSNALFSQLSEFIYESCGVKMSPCKKTMLMARLSKRMRHLGIASFHDYYKYVTSSRGQSEELEHMINVVTTNKTDFFREPGHFDFLLNTALPELKDIKKITDCNKLNVWSAGCSTGEEAYTISMFLSEFFGHNSGDFNVLATDISTRVLDVARSGIYRQSLIQPIPERFRKKYLLRGNASSHGLFCIVPELRKKVRFHRINLIAGKDFGIKGQMDIIFCRNVIIYFDRETQIRLFDKFTAQLKPGGFMFIGHSESLHGINNSLFPVGAAVYRKPV